MAQNSITKLLTLSAGDGTEIPNFDISKPYQKYIIVGSVVAAINSYTPVFVGTPKLGTTIDIEYYGSLGLNGNNFTIQGFSFSQSKLLNPFRAIFTYDGINWNCIVNSTTQTGIATIETSNIIDGAVITTKLADDAVTTAKIADLNVTTLKIGDQQVTTAKIADLNVTNDKIDNATIIGSQKIFNGSIDNAQLANANANSVIGNTTGAPATPTYIDIPTLFENNAWVISGNPTTTSANYIGNQLDQSLNFLVANTLAGRLSSTATSNVAFGINALSTDGGIYNVAIGNQALENNGIGDYNIAIGNQALNSNNSGTNNIAVGSQSLKFNLTGVGNTSVGDSSLISNNSGSFNTSLGYTSLSVLTTGNNNVAIGNSAGQTLLTGSNNTIIGATADVNNAARTNSIALGFGAVTTADNQFALPSTVTDWQIRGNNFTLPASDGAANAALITDGSGTLSFGTIIDSGTYTPTLSNNTNITASTAYVCQWMRVGSVVTVSGKVTIEPTAGPAASELGLTLPIASNFAAEEDCGGTALSDTSETNIRIMADAANNRASLVFQSLAMVASDNYSFTFTYRII